MSVKLSLWFSNPKGKTITVNSAKIFYKNNKNGNNDPTLIYEVEGYHFNHVKNECRAYKLLGIYLDEYFTLNYHTTVLCDKQSKSSFCINKAKNYLTKKALIMLYYAFSLSSNLLSNNSQLYINF
jgi:hypothetical protein